MKDEAKKQLKQILASYDDRLAEIERQEAASRAAKEAFPGRFAALRKEMILPALQELAEVLNARGHEATINEQDESSSASGGVTSAAIALRVIPRPFVQKATDTKKSFIEITFSAYRSERKIVVSSTTTLINSGGSVGKRGEYDLDSLTPDVVVTRVIQTLEESLVAK